MTSVNFVPPSTKPIAENETGEVPKTLYEQLKLNKELEQQKHEEEQGEQFSARVLNDDEVEFLDEQAEMRHRLEAQIEKADQSELSKFHVSQHTNDQTSIINNFTQEARKVAVVPPPPPTAPVTFGNSLGKPTTAKRPAPTKLIKIVPKKSKSSNPIPLVSEYDEVDNTN
eukprot:c5251_g1_i2.p1 GENE.c5251_g1_i2~~c5251_g1_i2.p1  ORF type:complete len:170 (-),score=26.87 c5251_g1_i2:34-543(-)